MRIEPDKLCLIKLPNNNRLLVDPDTDLIPQLIFGIHGIRSNNNSVIVNGDYILYRGIEEMSILSKLKSKLDGIDCVFFVYSKSDDEQKVKDHFRRFMRYSKELGFRKGILINYSRFVNATFKSQRDYDALKEYYAVILSDYDFQISHIRDMKLLNGLKERLTYQKTQLSRFLDQRNMLKKQLEPAIEENIDKIVNVLNRTPWIESVSRHAKGLSIKTKPLQMNLVPNIGRTIDPNKVAQSAIMYNIIKNQCLGYNFVSPSCEYLIPYDMNVVNNESSEKDTMIKKWIRKTLMFHGMNPHIGTTGSCYGEFASAISSAQKYGLDFLVMSLEAFLRSANLPDSAGMKIVNMPMGDKDGNIMCWPYVDDVLSKNKISYRGLRDAKVYEKLLQKQPIKDLFNRNGGLGCSFSVNQNKESYLEGNLELIKQREPKIYDKIMQRIKEGAVL